MVKKGRVFSGARPTGRQHLGNYLGAIKTDLLAKILVTPGKTTVALEDPGYAPVRGVFLAVGANPLWWPMASNPKYFRPQDVLRSIAVSFVGANYSLRARYIGYLLENGIDAHAYGPGWASGDHAEALLEA